MGRRWVPLFVAGWLLLPACQKAEVSETLHVTHGMEIRASVFPEVVKIHKGKKHYCTGIWVRKYPPTLLTASHCLNDMPTREDWGGGVLLGKVESAVACVPEGSIGHFNPRDLAVVVFKPGSIRVPAVAKLGTTVAAAKANVTLVGFGRNDATEDPEVTGSGVKRLGKNCIESIMPQTDKHHFGMVHLKGAVAGDLPSIKEIEKRRDSSSGHGDSGGALFLETPQGPELVGITSGGHVDDEIKHSYYVNLTDPEVKKFVDRVLEPTFLTKILAEDLPREYFESCQLSDRK